MVDGPIQQGPEQQKGNSSFSSREAQHSRTEPFQSTERIEKQLQPSPKAFSHLVEGAIAQSEKDGRPFDAEKRERLERFGQTAYKVNAAMSGGRDNFVAAKLALAYELGREQLHADQDPILGMAYGYSAAQGTPYQIGMESAEEIADLARNTGGALDIMDTRSAEGTVQFKGLLTHVHAMREALLQGVSLGEFSRQHPYLPLVAATYLITNHMLEDRGMNQGEITADAAGQTMRKIAGMHGNSLAEHELGALAFQMPYAEQPPTAMMAADFQTRTYWSRTINGLRDHILTDYFPETARLVDETLADVTGISDYRERVLAASTMTIQQFVPGAKDAAVAVAATRPFVANTAHLGRVPFWEKGEGQTAAIIPSSPDVQLLDALIGKNEPREIQLQQSGMKSMWEILGKTLKDPGIVARLESLAGQVLSPLSQEMSSQLRADQQVIVLQSRIQLLNELLRDHADNQQVRAFVQDVRTSLGATSDMVRSRAFFTQQSGELDAFCRDHLAGDPNAFVLLWYPGGVPEKVVPLQEVLANGGSVETLLQQLRDSEDPNNPNFGGVFIHRQITLPGSTKPVMAEFHFGRYADAKRNWEARQEYKLQA